MTFTEACEALRADGALAVARHKELRAAYLALGIDTRTEGMIEVALDLDKPMQCTHEATMRQLRMPFVFIVSRDGYPNGCTFLVGGESEEDVMARVRPARMGPNGPIDSCRIVREPGKALPPRAWHRLTRDRARYARRKEAEAVDAYRQDYCWWITARDDSRAGWADTVACLAEWMAS